MAKGSFKGLYTFEEIAKVYGMSHSNIRKMVQANKFVENKEIKKFGKTWIITEEAVRDHFGNDKIDDYIMNMKSIKIQEKASSKSPKSKVSNNKSTYIYLSSSNDDLGTVDNLDYVEVDKSNVISSFSFSADN